jgi:hypothetical protein
MTDEEIKIEWLACSKSPIYFAHHYCRIYDAGAGEWVPFHLWREQARTMKILQEHDLVIILKARQLGLTWLVLAFVLWLMLFQPEAAALLFSRRDTEAVHLLDERLKGMYIRLPTWMQARAVVVDNDHEWALSNGSIARAFPTTAGDSYTAGIAVVDEADLVPDLNRLMRAVKPTIDGGGKMILLSRSDKTQPSSEFKAIYRAAVAGTSPWTPVFLPWHVHPSRDAAWYAAQKAEVETRTGSLDDLHEQYPATDSQALSARIMGKRIPPAWIERNFVAEQPLPADTPGLPAINDLSVFRPPLVGRRYAIGADPAEGNPNSDDSALEVVDIDSGEEVASLAGKFEPAVLAGHIAALSDWYNRAGVLVERNNHGHAVLLALRDSYSHVRRLVGPDGKPGWLDNSRGKTLLYTTAADAFREGDTALHDFATQTQLGSIEGATLRAPDGMHDDRADALALALCARTATGIQDGELASAFGWT